MQASKHSPARMSGTLGAQDDNNNTVHVQRRFDHSSTTACLARVVLRAVRRAGASDLPSAVRQQTDCADAG